MKVSNKKLLLIASIVWLIAGYNVLSIGIKAYSSYISIINIILSIIIFVLFQKMVFGPLVNKHTTRIKSYIENMPFYYFFDKKSFIIMAIMMSGGILIRVLELAPEIFISIFYTGLGSSLFLAGILFMKNYIKY